jgi:succinyl-CoA synthetase beta subunit
MKLPEYRGKELLKSVGIKVPPSIVTNNKSYINLSFHKNKYKEFFMDQQNVIIKAQVIAGSRKKAGLIIESDNYSESLKLIDQLYKKECNGNRVDTLLIEQKLNVTEEFFLAIIYDTQTRKPMIIFSKEGGIEIEDIAKITKPVFFPISALHGLTNYQARDIAKEAGFTGLDLLQVASLIKKAYTCFEKYDCRSLEINPVIKTARGLLFAGDAKIVIDDNAVSRQDIFHDVTDIEDKSVLSPREMEARKIDYHDHRGVAGKTFVELEGDIAILASGGGASLTAMDAILEAGGKPANYTEYSGNPPKEKVKKLTQVTLAKPGLNGCLVIGGKANFTDIFETLSGFMEALQEMRPAPKYPIVIRRAGPRDKEAFDMIQKIVAEKGYDITLYGEDMPMSKAARVMTRKVQEYKAQQPQKDQQEEMRVEP